MCVFIFIITYNYRDHCTHKNGISNCCYCYQSSLPSSGSGKWSDHRASLDVDEYLTGIIIIIINYYYSLKIFPRFWLAKGTRIIHHNQLLMTKFGNNVQNAARYRLRHCYREDLGKRLSCFGCGKKMADISLVSRVRTTAGTRQNNS